MLFIREYDTKSLDRSSVSMIDKYNVRLNRVGELLDTLSTLINNLLSLIRDIRNTLGQSKQRIYDNLDQVKEVINGNDITGTEATIKTIEDALEAGDKAIDEAEAALEGVGRAIDCSEEYISDANGTEECGETCNETPNEADEDCTYCNYSGSCNLPGDSIDICTVCAHGECSVDTRCDEGTNINTEFIDGVSGCTFTSEFDPECGETVHYDGSCFESTCSHTGEGSWEPPLDCTFSCDHSSGCQELPMPEGCTYSCVDGEGCAYSGDDCSYGTTCGQADSCNQSDCGQYDCGEPCGETCHMTTDDDGDCSETSCGECSDDLSDDDYYGGDDGDSDMCGEDCGDSCGL